MVQSATTKKKSKKPKQLGPIGKARQEARNRIKAIRTKQRSLKTEEAVIRRELGLKKRVKKTK